MTAWLASVRLALRDLWAQGRRSAFFALLVAAGVASLVGVQGVARTLEDAAHGSARQMMQGDLKLVLDHDYTARQQEAVGALESRGAQITRVTGRIAYAASPDGKQMLLVEGKVVDPAVWPFYGGLTTNPDRPLTDLLAAPDQVLVAPALLDRLGLKVGQQLLLAGKPYTIAGVIEQEPQDFSTGQIPLGPRVLLSAKGAGEGASAMDGSTLLVKLPDSLTPDQARALLLPAFEQARVITYTEAWRNFADLMDKIFGFLSLVAFVSLLVGGLGVAMAMRSFINQKLEHIAVLKALGATSGRIMTVFLTQAAVLGLGGSLLGAALGLGVQQLLPALLKELIPLTGQTGLNLTAGLLGVAVGTLIALIFALLPVRSVRDIRPNVIFRADSAPVQPSRRSLLESALILLVVIVGLAWLAVSQAGSVLLGLGFLGGMLSAGLQLTLLVGLLLLGVRMLPQSGMPALRHALRSIQAPGSQSWATGVAMAMGILLMMVVYLLQVGLLQQVKAAEVQPDAANLMLLNVPADDRAPLRAMLQEHSAVTKVFDPMVMVSGTLVAVDGKAVAESWAKAPLMLLTAEPKPEGGVRVLAGKWLTAAEAGRPFIMLDEKSATDLGAKLGSTLRLRLKESEIELTVQGIHTPIPGSGLGGGVRIFQTPPGTLDSFAEMYMVSAAVKPDQVTRLSAEIMERFPRLVPLSLVDLLGLINQTLAKMANVLRFITGFAVVAAAVILSGSLSATRFRRRKEAALMKSLGASRLAVSLASALENAILGGVAGLAGGGLGYLLVQVILLVAKTGIILSPWPLPVALLGGSTLAVVAGLASTLDVLNVRPLQVLRGE